MKVFSSMHVKKKDYPHGVVDFYSLELANINIIAIIHIQNGILAIMLNIKPNRL